MDAKVETVVLLHRSGRGLAAGRRCGLGSDTPPLLTLDDAISIALKDNPLIRNSMLEKEKNDFQLSSVRSRRLRSFASWPWKQN